MVGGGNALSFLREIRMAGTLIVAHEVGVQRAKRTPNCFWHNVEPVEA
jgi:hypothetical protein